MPLDQPHELTWGALVLDSETTPDVPWVCKTLAEGSTLGNPIPLVEELRSMLTDGSLAVTTGYDNRTITFRVRLSAPDGQVLAQAETAFMAEVLAEHPSPLYWTPPNLEAWTAAFDVVGVQFDRDFEKGWDFHDRFQSNRYYTVTFTCLPWARDLDTTTIPALPPPADPDEPPVVISINDCTSASNWDDLMWPSAAWSAVTVTQTGGYVQVAGSLAGGGGDASISAVLTDAETMGSTTYLQVDVYPTVNPDGSPVEITAMFSGDSTTFEPVAALATGTPGVTRYWFEAPSSWSTVRIRRVVARPKTGGTARSLRVYDVSKTDRIEIASNGLQVARTAFVGGSAPTQAALTFGDGETALCENTALIYTGTSPAVPLRGLATDTATEDVDAALISGASNDLSSPMVFLVPIEQLRTATFSLLARINSSGSETIEWSAKIVDSTGADIPGSEVIAAGEVLVKNITGEPWMIHCLASIQMPVVAIDGSTTHCVEVTIDMASDGEGVVVDEAWLFDTDNGAVTFVNNPTAFDLAAIELRSPQLDAPLPAVIGTWVDHGAQDISRHVESFGTHLFWPGLLYVFTAADKGRFAPTSLTYYRRHHSHPGPDPVAPDAE